MANVGSVSHGDPNFALNTAIEDGNFATVSALIKEGVDLCNIDSRGKHALDYAIDRVIVKEDGGVGVDILKAVVQNIPTGVECHNVGGTDFQAVKLLADRYVLSQDEMNQLMIDSAQRHEFGAVDYLIWKGANVNAVDKHGETALSYSIEDRYFDGVKYLVDHGASVLLVGNLHGFQELLGRVTHGFNPVDMMNFAYIEEHPNYLSGHSNTPTFAEIENAQSVSMSNRAHGDAGFAHMAHGDAGSATISHGDAGFAHMA